MRGDFSWCRLQQCSLDRVLLVGPLCQRPAILLNTALRSLCAANRRQPVAAKDGLPRLHLRRFFARHKA